MTVLQGFLFTFLTRTSGSAKGTTLASRPERALRSRVWPQEMPWCPAGRGWGRADSAPGARASGLTYRPPSSPSPGRRLRDWELHQAHPHCRAGYHLFHPAAAAGAGGGDPPGAVAGDRQSHQGRDSRGQAGLGAEKWCLEASLAATVSLPLASLSFLLPPRERGSPSVYACGGSRCQ